MSDFLTNHAIKNVWCTPNQDLQVIYRPQRISQPRGVRNHIDHMWATIPLPTANEVYHVYQIGQWPPQDVGLATTRNVWRTLGAIMEEEKLFADLYTQNGKHLVRREAFVLVLSNKNVLVAIREQTRVVDLRNEPIFLRLYSNAFFNSERSFTNSNTILCKAARVTTAQQALNFQRDYQAQRELTEGYTLLFVNGVYRDDYTPGDYKSGDYLEYVYDSSIKMVVDLPVSEAHTFDSVLDSKRKYLMTYSQDQVGGQIIDYRDDIDVYLIRPNSATSVRYRGLYYHKNNDDAFRQVTHRDYAVTVDYVEGYRQAMLAEGWDTLNRDTIRLIIRHSGYSRPLIFENNRIQELYKLPFTQRRDAMLGVDSTVENWRAYTLENSKYIQLMDVRKRGITNDLVRDAYGYNAIAKLIGDCPLYVGVISGRPAVSLPYGGWTDSTAFEIDSAGKLINSYVHTSGPEYAPFNANCEMIELIIGRGGNRLDMVFNTQDVPINPKRSYRFYVAPYNHGSVLNDMWRDVTGDTSYYEIIDGKVHWFANMQYNAVCVKSDGFFLNYELDLTADTGLMRFSINATTVWSGVDNSGVLYIPPGRLDIWMNNECLIEGLDYIVRWPEVVITNKRYLKLGQAQRVRVRATGFCDNQMHLLPAKEVGFVRWGKLSRNNRYDLRDDRVIRLVVNGRTYHRDDVYFTEQDPSLWMDNVPNGSPYTLDDLIVPLRRVVDSDTYELREQSLAIDRAVSDYLTLKMPEVPPENPDPIPERYEIFSPFTAKVMYDLINGTLSTEGFRGHYSDQDVRNYLVDYEWLLNYEPTREDLDLEHVHVHPHERTTVVELDAYQYFLLNRAIKVFLEDKVDITRFVRIKDSFI